jgi:hypothetical protein
MNIPQESEKRWKRPSPQPGLGTAAFILFFAIMLFLLVQSMEHHHFFSGGRNNDLTKMPNH